MKITLKRAYDEPAVALAKVETQPNEFLFKSAGPPLDSQVMLLHLALVGKWWYNSYY